MKRRILCLILATVLLCLPGCKPDWSLEGTWTAELDALQTVLPALPEAVSMLQLGALPVTVELTMKADGHFTFAVDQESVQKAEEALWQKAEKLLEGKESDSQGLKAALEGLLGVAADKLKEGLQNVLEDAQIGKKITAAYTCSGTYEDNGKELTLKDEEGNAFLAGKYLLLGEKLAVTAPFSGVALLVFQKQK